MTFIDPAAYDHAAKQQNEMLDALHAELNHRVAQVQELQSKLPSWIKTAERKPAPSTDVLCYYDDATDEAHVLAMTPAGEWYRQCDDGNSWAEPTYWMPLPEPPNAKP